MSEPIKKIAYGDWLKALLNSKHMKMTDLSNKSGVSHTYISDCVNKKMYPGGVSVKRPSYGYVEAMARALNENPATYEIEFATHLVAAGHCPQIPVCINWDAQGNPIVEPIDNPTPQDPQEAMRLQMLETMRKMDAMVEKLNNIFK